MDGLQQALVDLAPGTVYQFEEHTLINSVISAADLGWSHQGGEGAAVRPMASEECLLRPRGSSDEQYIPRFRHHGDETPEAEFEPRDLTVAGLLVVVVTLGLPLQVFQEWASRRRRKKNTTPPRARRLLEGGATGGVDWGVQKEKKGGRCDRCCTAPLPRTHRRGYQRCISGDT